MRTRLRLLVIPRRRINDVLVSSPASSSASNNNNNNSNSNNNDSLMFFVHAEAIREPNDQRRAEASRKIEEMNEGDVMKRLVPAFAQNLIGRGTNYAQKTWTKWGESEPGSSFGRRVFDAAQNLLARVDPDEDVLKAIPSTAIGSTLSSCEIVYPKSVPIEDVRVAIHSILTRGKTKARRAKYFNMFLVPITLPLFLSPISNFPIYWFLYRSREAWIGCKGSESAKKLLLNRFQQPELVAEDDRETQKALGFKCLYTEENNNINININEQAACCRISAHDESHCAVTFAPCEKLDDVLFPELALARARIFSQKSNFWQRLTSEQILIFKSDEQQIDFAKVLMDVEKITGATDLSSLNERYERYDAINNKKKSSSSWF